MSAEGREPQELAQGPGGHPGASRSGRRPPRPPSAPWRLPPWRARAAAAVLCYINLLNYMNWFIVAGMLLDLQNFFQISDGCAGLLQTVFVGCLLLSAPVFGYLGDRHSRKATLSIGILLWSGAGLSSSFLSPQYSWLFFLSRGVVGTGSASYSTIAPTVLGDLFVREQRTRVLAIFYIFIPVGSWSFVWSTLGVTAIAFVTGALGFWAPKFLFEARVVHGLQPPCSQEPCGSQDSLIFGALTVVTGIIGVVLGAEASRRYKKVNPRAEPLVCACSLLIAAPCLYLALTLAPATFLASYVLLALGELLLSCNWALVADILLSVVVPRCRGTAEALQITVGHILGDAGSPYLTGLISSSLRAGRPDSYLQAFLSLQQSFLCCAFIIALGGGCFLLTALRLESDQARAQVPGTGTLPRTPSTCTRLGPSPPGPAALATPKPAGWDPGQQGHGEPSPAFWRRHRHRGPLRTPPPAPLPPQHQGPVPLWLWLRAPGRAAPAISSLQPESWQGLWRGIELSAPSAGGLGPCLRPVRQPWVRSPVTGGSGLKVDFRPFRIMFFTASRCLCCGGQRGSPGQGFRAAGRGS
ncbi:protein spinster homolog 3 isoform X2 [Suricata suricatta]|uniref:protein spinster homolog 3 isoform X2 n=1 Tax=Suricata suricatta TaxID=37032 RepID=UPI001155C456|nr:protein spinster homolog 3 isoform X2 [Suricata suricatta]